MPGCLMVALMDSGDALRELNSLTYSHSRLTKRDRTVRRKLASLTCAIIYLLLYTATYSCSC